MERTLTKGIFMVNEVLMVVKITIAMLGGATFPVDIEMITTQEHCEQEIKNFNPSYTFPFFQQHLFVGV